jgi:hypothetical protein
MHMLVEKTKFSKYDNTYIDIKSYVRSISLSYQKVEVKLCYTSCHCIIDAV